MKNSKEKSNLKLNNFYLKLVSLIFIFLLIQTSAISQNIQWMKMEDALAAQKIESKKLIVYFYKNSSKEHSTLLKYSFKDKDLVNYMNEHFYSIKIDVTENEILNYKGVTYSNPNHRGDKQGQHQFARALRIDRFPSFVLFDEEANYNKYLFHYKTTKNLLTQFTLHQNGF